MKLPIIICLAITGITCSCKFSEKKLPKEVIESFQSRFPDAKMIKWEKEKKIYEAEFILNGTEVSALFDKKGHLLEVETGITPSQLPLSVLNSLAREFPDFKVEEADKIESDQSLIYEVKIQNNSGNRTFFISSEGKILKEEKKED